MGTWSGFTEDWHTKGPAGTCDGFTAERFDDDGNLPTGSVGDAENVDVHVVLDSAEAPLAAMVVPCTEPHSLYCARL